MSIKNLIKSLFILCTFSTYAQDMVKYTSGWEGKIENEKVFNLKIEIENLGLENSHLP